MTRKSEAPDALAGILTRTEENDGERVLMVESTKAGAVHSAAHLLAHLGHRARSEGCSRIVLPVPVPTTPVQAVGAPDGDHTPAFDPEAEPYFFMAEEAIRFLPLPEKQALYRRASTAGRDGSPAWVEEMVRGISEAIRQRLRNPV